MLWLSVAAVILVLLGAFAAHYLYKPRAHGATKPYDAIQNQQDGWIPTGRIDFFDPQSTGNFILHVEETRIVRSTASVEHCQIRWRRATLKEADSVLVAYHTHRLAMASKFIVASSSVMRRDAALRIEQQQKAQLKKDGASTRHSESDGKIADTGTDLIPTASD